MLHISSVTNAVSSGPKCQDTCTGKEESLPETSCPDTRGFFHRFADRFNPRISERLEEKRKKRLERLDEISNKIASIQAGVRHVEAHCRLRKDCEKAEEQ